MSISIVLSLTLCLALCVPLCHGMSVSVAGEYGQVLGTLAIPHLLNKRWRTVSVDGEGQCYEWELRRQTQKPGSPTVLHIFQSNGVNLCRKAHCPQFLPNYINLEPNNHSGSDQIFRDNTVYFLDSTSCVLQNHWFTSRVDDTMYGPYFLDVSLPPMRSVRCGVTSWPKKQIPKLYKRSSDF
jgi:hypothetical protein